MRKTAFLYLGLATLIWGAAGPVIKFTLEVIDPLPFLAYRFMIAGSVGAAMLLTKTVKLPRSPRDLILLTIYALLSTTFGLWLLFIGLNNSSVLDLGVIALLGPLILVAGGALFFHDHVTSVEKFGIGIALVGTLLVIFEPLLADGGMSQIKFTGNIFLLLYLLADSTGALLLKKLLRKQVSPFAVSNFAFLIAALTILPLTINSIGLTTLLNSITALAPVHHLAVFYMAIFSGTLAYAFVARGLRSIEIGEAGLFAYMQPLISAPLAVLWLGESITPLFIVGAAIVATGIWIAERKQN